MPQNFLYLGVIKLMLPEARIIHCTRNPVDTCLSCYFNSFRESHQYACNLQELGQYYLLYDRLLKHWQQILGADIIEFAYEALIDNQENATRRLLTACGLEWNDACLSFHESGRTVMTASVNQVRRGLYSQSVQRWKHYEHHLQPLLDIINKS